MLRYRGEHVMRKGEIDEVAFLRGTFTREIRIAHRAEFADSPIRFFPLFSKDAFAYATSCGYPTVRRKAPFYTKGDIVR